MKKTTKNIFQKDIDKISNMFLSGKTVKEITATGEYSKRAVSLALLKSGINSKRRGRYTLDEDYFENIDSEQKAYFLGLLYADGFVGNGSSNLVAISLLYDDVDILEELSRLINLSGTGIVKEKYNTSFSKKYFARLAFSSKKMILDLNSHGMIYKKEKRLEMFPEISEDMDRHFIRGYFDGDGSISVTRNNFAKNGKEYSYLRPAFNLIGTKNFLKEVERKLNLFGVTKTRYNKCLKCEHLLYLNIGEKQSILSAYEYLYSGASTFLSRKKALWDSAVSICANTK